MAQSFSKYGALQDLILRSCLPITPIKNEWLSRVHFWIFGKIGVEKRLGQKTAYPDMTTFLPNFGKKSQDLRFERDLAEVWNIQIFGNLNIWTDRQIMANITQHDRQLVKNPDILAIKFWWSDDSWPKWQPVSCQNVISSNHVTTSRVISYDSVTTTRVISYNPVTTNRVISYNLVATTAVVSYDPVMTTRVVS